MRIAAADAVEDLASFRKPHAPWRDGLIKNGRGEPKALLANALTALRAAPEWQGVLVFDEFAVATKFAAPPPWHAGANMWRPRNWLESDDTLVVDWLHHQGISIGFSEALAAVQAVAQENSYHPIKDYLGGLRWDGTERAGRWLSDYLGAKQTPLNAAVGTCFLIGAVARVMNPGCKHDHVPVIEGPQGVGKSTAVKILGGDWFSDDLADMGTKDAALGLRSAWIVEVSELDAMSRSEVAKIKAFVSRTTDRFRPPYGRRIIEQPRQSCFVGTTNATEYLRDESGGRRFWPVEITRLNRDALERDRDQLMHLSRRCGARTKSSGKPCRSPAMKNGRCRMHGGASPGAPKANRNALKHGRYTAEAIFRRQEISRLLRSLKSAARADGETASP